MGKDAPTLEEVAAFLEAAASRGPRDHALACLLALNGLSMQAVCAAQVASLHEEKGTRTLSVSLTGGPPIPVPLAPRTATAIDDYLEDRTDGPLLLADDGSALQRFDAARIVRQIVHTAGLDHRLGRF
jgi:integrase/recombinase XerD